ncbi:2'-5' RNA ligase [Salsuginibacillus halophilus]|uniref:2'-5' RNA ligase n=1 Tax=Salsuginibacillus halophilus TaxID=517424 RepID=A0A2P8HXD3_9BACI|nr:2'-5' RNA ligase family protein [Salsuginibacillus halophilus]PSL50891.1 2'-5' RNA ligase [Salsuginibacillus halophilus]
MIYGIACFPSKTIQDMANTFRKRYDSRYELIPPHLTLMEPFELSPGEEEEAVQTMREIGKSIPPYPLHVYKVDSFHPKENKIFLKVDRHQHLQKLHQDLHQSWLGDRILTQKEFTPHITLCQDLRDDEHFDVLDQLKMTMTEETAYVDRMQLFYQLDNEAWTVYETIHLTGKEERSE